MKTICFYISDYGYGHAARSIALIREMVNSFKDINIIVKTFGPFEFTKKSILHPRILVIPCRNDIEVPLKEDNYVVEREKTRDMVLAWTNTWDEYIFREHIFCKENNVDLILSDISPQPFLVADSLGIPGIAVSNFSWDTIFEHLYHDMSEIRLLRDAYRKASYACILPFDIAMEHFPRRKNVGLVSRVVTISRSEMRRRIGIRENDFLVYIGRTTTGRFDSLHPVEKYPGIRFLLPSGIPVPDTLNIPVEETESQNWIGMCDCVVTKCGYSTVSEAVRANIPLLLWKREGFIEDEAITAKVENLGIGRTVRDMNEGIQYCLAHRSELETFRRHFDMIDPLYHEDGINGILTVIQRMM